MDCQSEICIF